jgi:mRNA interferase RelE/StbE
VFETENYSTAVDRMLPAWLEKIRGKLNSYVYPQLRQEPHFGANIKKLRGWSPPTWRYRIGPWRIFFEVEEREKIVFLTALHARKDAY